MLRFELSVTLRSAIFSEKEATNLLVTLLAEVNLNGEIPVFCLFASEKNLFLKLMKNRIAEKKANPWPKNCAPTDMKKMQL